MRRALARWQWAAAPAIHRAVERRAPSWVSKAEGVMQELDQIKFCLPKYTAFVSTTNPKDLKRAHVFMNDEAQGLLAEFYLCCAMSIRPDAVEACGNDNQALLELAQAVAEEDVEPLFDRCREFVADYDEPLHGALVESTQFQGDHVLFWDMSFRSCAPHEYLAFQQKAAAAGVEDDIDACAEWIRANEEGLELAKAVYFRFLESSSQPVKGRVRDMLISHGVMAGKLSSVCVAEPTVADQEANRVKPFDRRVDGNESDDEPSKEAGNEQKAQEWKLT
jgi:hypothetical protein